MKKLVKLFGALIALGFLGGLFLLGMIIYISFDLPQINSLSDYNPPIPSRILSRDGEVLLEVGKENRVISKFEDIPKKVLNSFLAAEDDNFFNHSGVDYAGILRAFISNIKAGRVVQGGSTITQQVAKSLLLNRERSYTRKIKDLLLAKKIEEKFTKQEILYLYLNQVYLGGGYYGVKAAFRGYFEKELSEATHAECALIAGLLVAPGKYSPYINPKKAKMRQKYVLKRLYKTKKITKEEYETALVEDIRMQLRQGKDFKAGYFTDWIRQQVIDEFGKDNFLSNGFEVVTTIDWELQKIAEAEVLKGARGVDKRQGYRGPLETISVDNIYELNKSQREKIYKKVNNYSTFKSDGSILKEYEFKEEELEVIKEYEESFEYSLSKNQKKYFEYGLNPKDEFIELINLNEDYKAVIIKISDLQRVIYANIAGLKVAIPYDGFKWAHERKISDERNYYSYITKPSSVFNVGDVVWVRLNKKPTSVWNHLYKDFKTRVKDKTLIQAIKEQKYFIGQVEQKPEAQSALVSLLPKTGEVISLVGGIDFKKSQFNRAVQSNRQPGSAFKPLIFAASLENGFTPSSVLLDSPQALGGVDSSLSWKPRNYDGKFKGQMTLRRALETSRNIPTIRLVQEVGVTKMVDFAKRIDIPSELPSDLSISLGSFGISLLELVKAYAIFPNGGRKMKIKTILSIKDRFGKVYHLNKDKEEAEVEDDAKVADKDLVETEIDETEKIEKKEKINPFLVNLNEDQVYDTRLSYLMTSLLRGVIENGTGRRAKDISNFIGGKTGTTNNFVDAWFLGFSSNIVTGVWTGFDNNKTLGWGETGAKAALPIWKVFMKNGLKRYGESDFRIPSGIINVLVDKETGKLANSNNPKSFMESFIEGTEPGREVVEEENEDDSIEGSMLDDEFYSGQ